LSELTLFFCQAFGEGEEQLLATVDLVALITGDSLDIVLATTPLEGSDKFSFFQPLLLPVLYMML
jgi:hypothetical protein